MAEKEIWAGSFGPFLYDDTDQYPDGINFRGVRAAQFYADDAASSDYELMRKIDMENAITSTLQVVSVSDITNPTELGSIDGQTSGALALAAQYNLTGPDYFTLYAFDETALSPTAPYIMLGTGGIWIAVCGKYSAQNLSVKNSANTTAIEARRLTTGTTTINAVIEAIVRSSGTAANGLGPAIILKMEDSGGVDRNSGIVATKRAGSDTTHALLLGSYNAGTKVDNLVLNPNGRIDTSTGTGFTPEGGLFITLTNRTGSASVKGSIVSASTTYENAFSLTGLPAYKAIGAVYDAGIADGSECRIVIAGIAEVLLENSTAATKGHWVKTSTTTGGRADATSLSEPGATLAELQEHSREIGHCIDDAVAGTNVLARIVMHFN